MNITGMNEDSRWLLLVFTLPTRKASERVQIWRKLQRFGSIPFRNAGSLLPNTTENQERFEWLATAVRASKGEASILQIQAIDDMSSDSLQDQFRKAHRLYASVTGNHQVSAVDTQSLKTLGTAGPINYPDGLAYAPKQNKVFVSDEHGGVDAVIDAVNNKLIANIPLGGGAGNTVYDSVSGNILAAVHGVNLLAVIDPATNQIVNRIPLAGITNPHGIALDAGNHVAFVAGERNHSLAVVDLNAMKVLSTYQVGEDPDVLAYDPGLKRLYVSAESGTVTVFQNNNRKLDLLSSFEMPHAHTVSVDPKTHLVYFPLENIDGHPILRIMQPVK
jgi:DNA-binding beta-propeller fold protein YncE